MFNDSIELYKFMKANMNELCYFSYDYFYKMKNITDDDRDIIHVQIKELEAKGYVKQEGLHLIKIF